MAAAATATRRAPARRAPARRRTAPARRTGAHLIPIAVGTATAVRGLPDSSPIVRMTRGRAWIGVLGVLLAGIVALNVVTLSLSATEGRVQSSITALDEENPFLRSREAKVSSAARVRHDAIALGLVPATTDRIGSVTATPRDAEIAARRLAAAGGY